MSSNDHYALLGVSKSSSPDEVKRAFRKLALQYHPDQGGSNEAFRELKEAFEHVLKNAVTKSQQEWSRVKTAFGRYDPFTDPDYFTYEFFEPENSELGRFERSILAQGCSQCQGLGVKTKITDPAKGFMSLEERFCICQRVK